MPRIRQPAIIGLVLATMALTVHAISPEKPERPTAQQAVAACSRDPRLHAAFAWFDSHSRQLSQFQVEVTGVPAPPFQESRRAEWLRQRFVQLGLENLHIDGAGNLIGIRPGASPEAQAVLLSAHLDTVFPPGTGIEAHQEGARLFAPGICDNGSGLTALFAIASAMQAAQVRTLGSVIFLANVGEEGEGDLRGMRFVFADPHWSEMIGYSVAVDGGGVDTVISEALGSRRFVVTFRGPGGHSWSDFGVPNPVVAMARAIDLFSGTSVPVSPKTTYNVGVVEGGTSVNSIPESATMKVDIRSSSPAEIDRVERALHSAAQQALDQANTGHERRLLEAKIEAIGDRPAAEVDPNARILQVIRAVDALLGISSRIQRASTDSNVPISMGRQAMTLGGGGSGGGAHTMQEWYDTANRELGLRRILLAVVTLAGVPE